MAHEKLKKQYEEDRKKCDRPWELWEFRSPTDHEWTNCCQGPGWFSHYQYRRKEPPFESEYFSGLNWRDAEHLIGKVVEFSDDGNHWTSGIFSKYSGAKNPTHKFLDERLNAWIYIRTTPETHTHPTITLTVNGREWVLPKPETEAPEIEMEYWAFDTAGVQNEVWQDSLGDNTWLECGCLHLTKDRAKAWADFWRDGILAQIGKSI